MTALDAIPALEALLPDKIIPSIVAVTLTIEYMNPATTVILTAQYAVSYYHSYLNC
jgi:hypothetical protein